MKKILKWILSDNNYLFLKKVKYLILRCLMKLFWIVPVDEKKVVFDNFNGNGYGDNPKYIADEMQRHGDYNIFFVEKKTIHNVPDYYNVVKCGTIKYIYHLATAGIWVANNRMGAEISKRRKQIYVQTWHGSIALKKIEKDAEATLDDFYVYNAKRDSKNIDLMISNSSFSDNMFSNSFWYNGMIAKTGSPRCDILFSDKRGKFRGNNNIPDDNVIVLYAPTFRNSMEMDVYKIDFKNIQKAILEKTGKLSTILFRFHPNLIDYINIDRWIGDSKDVINVTEYPDVYELMLDSDILITDYSSLMFEFPLAYPKPVFIYATDISEYDRGFYFDISTLPFPVGNTMDELIGNISTFDAGEYKKKLCEFYTSIDILEDGMAARRIVELINNMMLRDKR